MIRNSAFAVFIVSATTFMTVAAATDALGQTESWKCSARGMISGSYDGGSSAYIHLQGFQSGGNYAVNKKGKVASGVTKNGTTFTCRAK